MRRACVQAGSDRGRAEPGSPRLRIEIGARARELAAARELLRPAAATGDHDRVLDIVADRLLEELLAPAGSAVRDIGQPPNVVVSVRAAGRVAQPAAC